MPYFRMISNIRPTTYVEGADYAAAEAAVALLALEGERTHLQPRAIPEITSVGEARELFNDEMQDEDYQDNFREGFEDDADAMRAYNAAADSGCCGSADLRYLIAGRFYLIGCNYGH